MSNKKELNRRSFLKKTGLFSLGGLLATNYVFANNFPEELSPLPLPNSVDNLVPGKSENLNILNSKPWNAETPVHLLDPSITPNDLLFVRNNGIPPKDADPKKWTLTIDGESVQNIRTYTIEDLKTKFKTYSYQLVIECGGNGRSEFSPPAKGNQWGLGAVGCPKWTGVRLKDVLLDAGISDDAVYIGYHGADKHLSGDEKKEPISRGVPIQKALEDESLIAWAMNDEDLPVMNGYPLRLVFGGWPASTSGKWLTGISIRNKVHDGAKMTGYSYRVPKYPVAPGTDVPEEDMKIIESMPVKSIITYPKSGAVVNGNQEFEVRGHAWAGDLSVRKVEVSIDFGATWKICELEKAPNRLAWQRWKTNVSLPKEGYYEIWAKATDSNGKAQPMLVPGWNPKGYLNNACHRIAAKRI